MVVMTQAFKKLAALIAVVIVALALGAVIASADAPLYGPTTYHGGQVITKPRVVLVVWGSQWGDHGGGLNYAGDPVHEVPTVVGFLRGLGTDGEGWSGILTTYCQAKVCGPNVQHVAYSNHVYGGILTDERGPAPYHATPSDFASEVTWARSHWRHPNPSTIYLVLSPTGALPFGYDQNTCASHAATTSGIPYINLPYLNDAAYRNRCNVGVIFGENGAIIYSLSTEYAETVTDPFVGSGWLDSIRGNEIADNCAWIISYIRTATGIYPANALQPSGSQVCAMAHPVEIGHPNFTTRPAHLIPIRFRISQKVR